MDAEDLSFHEGILKSLCSTQFDFRHLHEHFAKQRVSKEGLQTQTSMVFDVRISLTFSIEVSTHGTPPTGRWNRMGSLEEMGFLVLDKPFGEQKIKGLYRNIYHH